MSKNGSGAKIGTNNNGGRKLSKEYAHTIVIPVEYILACTTYCNCVVSGRAARIKMHLEKCHRYQKRNQDQLVNVSDDDDNGDATLSAPSTSAQSQDATGHTQETAVLNLNADCNKNKKQQYF